MNQKIRKRMECASKPHQPRASKTEANTAGNAVGAVVTPAGAWRPRNQRTLLDGGIAAIRIVGGQDHGARIYLGQSARARERA